MEKMIKRAQDLNVYKLGFACAMEIYKITKTFPSDEVYGLTSQIRRSSRSVVSNLAEGWRKRSYKKVFLNKISDSSQEASETQTWLQFAYECGYISHDVFKKLFNDYEHIFAMLNTMEKKVSSFCSFPE